MARVLWLALLLAPCGALAQPADIDECGAAATRVARFAARTHGWSTPRPTVEVVGALGAARIWRATDTPACCSVEACSGTSERADALIATVGSRLIALSAERPAIRAAAAFEDRLARPFAPRSWRALVRAIGQPRDAGEAIDLAFLLYASVQPGLGRVDDAEAALAALPRARRATLRALVDRARARSHEVRSRAESVAGGYLVHLWVSRLVASGFRSSPMGASGDSGLRLVTIRIEARGVTLASDVPAQSAIARSPAPRVVEASR